ncbi:unannotated protein [freshwater metagenome]|uniref:Unannotated protein n=1 Tax=freshwater metagenome TaxID=449393 RepID=A0A6J6YBU1_9ZZZZ
MIAWELRSNQSMQSHRNLLSWQEVVAHRHRHRYIQKEDSRRTRQDLGALNLKVFGEQAHWRSSPGAKYGVANRLLYIQVKGVSIFIWLVLVRALMPCTDLLHLVAAGLILQEFAVKIAERLLPKSTHRSWGQFKAAFTLIDQTCLLKNPSHLTHLL